MGKKPPRHRPFGVLRSRKNLTAKGAGEPPKAETLPAELTFSEAAERSGIKPLPRVERQPPPRTPASAPTSTPSPAFELTHDDDWLEGYRADAGPSALRRLRGAPSATLDLHGASAAEAHRRVVAFLGAERARGSQLVLVIVGKGHHSPDGRGVLRYEIASWLSTAAAAHVVAFQTAPPRLGGSGGVLVLLARALPGAKPRL